MSDLNLEPDLWICEVCSTETTMAYHPPGPCPESPERLRPATDEEARAIIDEASDQDLDGMVQSLVAHYRQTYGEDPIGVAVLPGVNPRWRAAIERTGLSCDVVQ